jgi:DNA repair protein RAD57
VRLEQMLRTHPTHQALTAEDRPSFDRIHSLTVHDFQAQQSVIENHLQRAVEQYNVGLVVIDSIAANFRAYHNSSTSTGLTQRAGELIRLGGTLRRLARIYSMAIVVTNQVSDRFTKNGLPNSDINLRTSSPAPPSSAPSQSSSTMIGNTRLTLDYQQSFFTGWGDDVGTKETDLKSPALGLAWANQISARVVLKLAPDGPHALNMDGKRRRFCNVVFSPWSQPTTSVEYSIEAHGITSTPREPDQRYGASLDGVWEDDVADEEYP